jgi:cytochrome c-type biogenesis protein CcmH
MFWITAIALLLVAGLILAWPLLASGSNWKAAGLALLVVVPLGGALLYRDVGTPAAMNTEVTAMDTSDFNAMMENLRARLSENQDDIEGWLLLGRSLKSLQRYDEALDALQTAQRIAPEDPFVQVELAEAILFASGNPRISAEVRTLLQTAVARDPGQQKGLWLLGIDAAQQGQDEKAIEIWQGLLVQLDPASPVAASVQEQIDQARGRLGMTPVVQPSGVAASWPGIAVEVGLGDAAPAGLPDPLPETAVLFVIVRPVGQSGGPPLGVARINAPDFPVEVHIDDNNAMLPQRKLSQQERLSIQGRLSLSGTPGASPGDWESTPVEVPLDGTESVSFLLDSPVE